MLKQPHKVQKSPSKKTQESSHLGLRYHLLSFSPPILACLAKRGEERQKQSSYPPTLLLASHPTVLKGWTGQLNERASDCDSSKKIFLLNYYSLMDSSKSQLLEEETRAFLSFYPQ